MASDQTPTEYQALASPSSLGTGVFLRIGASGDTMVTFRENLTYDLCKTRGEGFAAFKWIPVDLLSYDAVVGSRCLVIGEPCSSSCRAPGCLCNHQTRQCVDASGNSNTEPPTSKLDSGELNRPPEIGELVH